MPNNKNLSSPGQPVSPGKMRLTGLALILLLGTLNVTPGQFPRPKVPGPNQSATVLVDTINRAREAYEFELYTLTVYEAARKTNYLEGELRALVESFQQEHEQHRDQLRDLLDHLGARYDEVKPAKKNYNWMESEAQVLERLIKAAKESQKQLATHTKKTRNATAHTVFEQLRDAERKQLAALEAQKRRLGSKK